MSYRQKDVFLTGPVCLEIKFPLEIFLLIDASSNLQSSLAGLVDSLGLLEFGMIDPNGGVGLLLTLLTLAVSHEINSYDLNSMKNSQQINKIITFNMK